MIFTRRIRFDPGRARGFANCSSTKWRLGHVRYIVLGILVSMYKIAVKQQKCTFVSVQVLVSGYISYHIVLRSRDGKLRPHDTKVGRQVRLGIYDRIGWMVGAAAWYDVWSGVWCGCNLAKHSGWWLAESKRTLCPYSMPWQAMSVLGWPQHSTAYCLHGIRDSSHFILIM